MRKITFLVFTLYACSLFGQMQLKTAVTEKLNSSNNWVTSSKTEYEYDTKGNLIKQTNFSYNEISKKWKKGDRKIYTYNVGNKLTGAVYTHRGNLSEKEVCSYDSNNRVTEDVFYSYSSENKWLKTRKRTFSYDTNNRVSLYSLYKWGKDKKWVNNYKYTLTYNIDGKVKSMLGKEWKNSQWVDGGGEVIFSYNSKGRLINRLVKLRQEIEYQYDNNGNLISRKVLEYNDRDKAWELYKKENYTYNTNELMSNFHPFKDKIGAGFEFVNETQADFHINNKLLSKHTERERTVYKYENATAKVANYGNVKIKIYPNPVNNFLTIGTKNNETLKKVNVYNILGNKLLTTNKKVLNLQSLSKGIYLLEVETNTGRTAMKKIIKQ